MQAMILPFPICAAPTVLCECGCGRPKLPSRTRDEIWAALLPLAVTGDEDRELREELIGELFALNQKK